MWKNEWILILIMNVNQFSVMITILVSITHAHAKDVELERESGENHIGNDTDFRRNSISNVSTTASKAKMNQQNWSHDIQVTPFLIKKRSKIIENSTVSYGLTLIRSPIYLHAQNATLTSANRTALHSRNATMSKHRRRIMRLARLIKELKYVYKHAKRHPHRPENGSRHSSVLHIPLKQKSVHTLDNLLTSMLNKDLNRTAGDAITKARQHQLDSFVKELREDKHLTAKHILDRILSGSENASRKNFVMQDDSGEDAVFPDGGVDDIDEPGVRHSNGHLDGGEDLESCPNCELGMEMEEPNPDQASDEKVLEDVNDMLAAYVITKDLMNINNKQQNFGMKPQIIPSGNHDSTVLTPHDDNGTFHPVKLNDGSTIFHDDELKQKYVAYSNDIQFTGGNALSPSDVSIYKPGADLLDDTNKIHTGEPVKENGLTPPEPTDGSVNGQAEAGRVNLELKNGPENPEMLNTHAQMMNDQKNLQAANVPGHPQLLNGPENSDMPNDHTNEQTDNSPDNRQMPDAQDNTGMTGGPGPQQMINEPGNQQVITGPQNPQLINGAGNPQMINGPSAQQMINGPSSQQMINGPGNQQMINGPGNIQMINGPGNQQMINGPGNMQMINGPGNQQTINGPGNMQMINGPGNQQTVNGPNGQVIINGQGNPAIPGISQMINNPENSNLQNGPESQQVANGAVNTEIANVPETGGAQYTSNQLDLAMHNPRLEASFFPNNQGDVNARPGMVNNVASPINGPINSENPVPSPESLRPEEQANDASPQQMNTQDIGIERPLSTGPAGHPVIVPAPNIQLEQQINQKIANNLRLINRPVIRPEQPASTTEPIGRPLIPIDQQANQVNQQGNPMPNKGPEAGRSEQKPDQKNIASPPPDGLRKQANTAAMSGSKRDKCKEEANPEQHLIDIGLEERVCDRDLTKPNDDEEDSDEREDLVDDLITEIFADNAK